MHRWTMRFFVFNYKIFSFLNRNNQMLEREPMQVFFKNKNVNAYKHKGFWMYGYIKR